MAQDKDFQKLEAAILQFRAGRSASEAKDVLEQWITRLSSAPIEVSSVGRSSTSSVMIDSPKPKTITTQPYPSENDADKMHSSALPHEAAVPHPPTQKLKSSEDLIYTQPYPCPDNCPDDLFELESGLPPTSSGFFLVELGGAPDRAPRDPLTRGSVMRQQYSINEHGMLVGRSNDRDELAQLGTTFIVPSLTPMDTINGNADLEKLFESTVQELGSSNEIYEYVIATAHHPEVRRNLGLPGPGLQPGSRLLSTAKHIPGLHSTFLYLSPGKSVFFLHREDIGLRSANRHWEGAPKLWLNVHPGSASRLESRVVEALRIQSPICHQFIRHRDLVIPPSLLRKWKVKFEIVLQGPGVEMMVGPDTYHQGINLDPNLAEAINYTEPDWIAPPLYTACCRKKFKWCPGIDPIRLFDMEIREPRPLDIDTTWEDPPRPAPMKKQKLVQTSAPSVPTLRSSTRLREQQDKGTVKISPSSYSSPRKARPKPNFKTVLYDDRAASPPPFLTTDSPSPSSDQVNTPSSEQTDSDPSDPSCSEVKSPDADKNASSVRSSPRSTSVPIPQSPPETPALTSVVDEEETPHRADSGPGDIHGSAAVAQHDGLVTPGIDAPSHGATCAEPKAHEVTESTRGCDFLENGEVQRAVPTIDISTYSDGSTLSGQTSIEQDDATVVDWHPQHTQRALLNGPPHALNLIDQMHWRIDFATKIAPKLAATSMPGLPLLPYHMPHMNLQRFLPKCDSPTDSWLDDGIVVSTIRLICLDRDDVYVVDSLTTTNAHLQQKPALLECDVDAKLILLPCHYEDHWCLIAVDTLLETLTVYDTSERRNIRAQFVFDCFLEQIPSLQYKHEALYPGPPDNWNCGLYTIFRAEIRLNPNISIITDPVTLRARYLERLLKPAHDHIRQLHYLDQFSELAPLSSKRPLECDSRNSPEPSSKKVRPFLCDVSAEYEQHDRSEALQRVGPHWLQCYSDLVDKDVLPADKIYHILALVSTVGSPQVLSDILDLCRTTPDLGTSHESRLYWLYQTLEVTNLRHVFKQRMIAIAFYTRFRSLQDDHRTKQQPRRRRLPTAADEAAHPNTRMASLALDDLVASCVGAPLEDVRQHPEKHKLHREKITRIKDKGKKVFGFNERLSADLGYTTMWTLLPMRRMRSFLDKEMFVNSEQYFDMNKDELDVFTTALKQLRPRLNSLTSQASQQDWIFFGTHNRRGPKLKLERLDPDVMVKEQLDSELLLSCFEVQ